ncbi:class I SAM-dependent methyltransferase [Nitrosopumilus maritimus]|uniref:Methyltransferase type 12 n=1 Tax=Nitrosopumilus maritimus (strain SCM1) TaxID=436308 RepID=A9A145_NITMS|nr:class I SAM-dependent methyltransferase [Nitrosopumilus maritimus]ABX12006.1 Methyltransferase type 12 [Nitrosopumilus maritimus SCM1]
MNESKKYDFIDNAFCPCCSSNNLYIAFEKSFFNLPVLKCNECGLHFIWDKNLTLNLEKYYDETYWDVFRNIKNKQIKNQQTDNAYLIKKFPKFIQKFFDWTGVRKSLSRSQSWYLLPLLKKKHSLFELGSGEGFILEFFEKNGFDVFGMEPSKINFSLINRKLTYGKCVTGSADDIKSIKKKFDVIILSHVFEHLKDCKQVLLDLKKILNPNGIIFIDVPNCSNLKTLHESIFTQPHIFHFTKKSIESLSSSTGFSIIKADFFYGKVSTFLDHIKYFLFWIFKKDFFIVSDQKNGNYLRIILTNSD